LLFHFIRLAVVVDAGILGKGPPRGNNAFGLPLTFVRSMPLRSACRVSIRQALSHLVRPQLWAEPPAVSAFDFNPIASKSLCSVKRSVRAGDQPIDV
jgi:hypothetical protein